MSLISLKLKLSRTILADKILTSRKIVMADRAISSRVKNFEYDYEVVTRTRQENRNKVLRLQRAMARVDKRELPKLAKGSIKYIRNYEGSLRRQLFDLIQIINHLKQLIENEDLELLYDVRNPLSVFEEFINQLKKSMKQIQFHSGTAIEIKNLIKSIETEYDNLINYVINLIEGDFKHFQTIGLDFTLLKTKVLSDLTIAEHMKQRALLKRQINGKTQWIIQRIKELETFIRQLKSRQANVFKQQLLDTIVFFRKQFSGLVQFCLQRADVANHMIVEAIVIQKEKYGQLEKIKLDLETFYKEFVAEQQVLRDESKSNYMDQQIKDRMIDFGLYEDDIKHELEKFEKNFNKKILRAEKKDIRILRIEKKEEEIVIRQLSGFRKKMKRFALTGLIALIGLSSLNLAAKGISQIDLTSRTQIEQTIGKEKISKVRIGNNVFRLSKSRIYVVCEKPRSALSKTVMSNIEELSSVGHLGVLFFDTQLGGWRVSEQVNFARTVDLNQTKFVSLGSLVFEVKGADKDEVVGYAKQYDNYSKKTDYFVIGKTCQSHVSRVLTQAGVDMKAFDFLKIDTNIDKQESEKLFNYFDKQTGGSFKNKLESSLQSLLAKQIPIINKYLSDFVKTSDQKVFHKGINLFKSVYNTFCVIYNMFFSHLIPFQEFMMINFGSSHTFIATGQSQGFLQMVHPN